MTIEQQKELWYKFHRFIKRYEAIYAPKFNAGLKEQINQYIELGTVTAIDASPLYPILVDLYGTVGYQWAHKSDVHRRTLKSRQPMGFSERIVELMRQYYGIDLLNDAEGLTQTTREQIQRVLSQAAELGWSFDEIVKKLQSPDLTKARSCLIARTETVTAANGAAYINAKETGLKLNKIWIAAYDHRTRRDHREINQHVVAMDEFFNVGGSAMLAPGDRSNGAGADQICNCRCCVAFLPIN